MNQSFDVKEWQHSLNLMKFTDDNGRTLVQDGDFGEKSKQATIKFQRVYGFPPDGVVKLSMLMKASTLISEEVTDPSLPTYPYKFIPAKNYTPGNRMQVKHIVIHTMEAPEKPKTAENVAKWFSSPDAPMASAHYCVDDAEVVQCVRDTDIAWHAPGANASGIGVEHAGFAAQTPNEWNDGYSQAVLMNSAKLAALLCARWNIPIRHLSVPELAAGNPGFAGHIDVTNAFNKGKGHTDPGPNFPWQVYLAMVTSEFASLTAPQAAG